MNGLMPEGGGDAPESGLEAVAAAIGSDWTNAGDRRRQVIVVWTDQPAQPLGTATPPAEYGDRIPRDFSALTDTWENEQGMMGASSKRLIMFAPDGPGWSDISSPRPLSHWTGPGPHHGMPNRRRKRGLAGCSHA